MMRKYITIAVLFSVMMLQACGGGGTNTGGSVQNNNLNLLGKVTTFAGDVPSTGFRDGAGAAARFDSPNGIAADSTNIYVTDSSNNIIRKIVKATGEVTTLAGSAGSLGSADGTGTAARFYYPGGIATDGSNLYVADTYNDTIRKIVIATGKVTTLAGSANNPGSANGTGAAASFSLPSGITTDGSNLYVADTWNHTIRKIVIATGVVSTLTGSAGSSGSADGTGAAAGFYYPDGIVTDGSNLYVADTWNHTIRKIVIATGEVSTLAGSAGSSGSANGTGAAARFNYPGGMVTDGTNLYVADTRNNAIRKIVIATGEVTTLAGSAGLEGSADGTGAAAKFNNPYGITTDGTNLYVADTNNNIIRKIVIATGEVTTLAGSAEPAGSADGTGVAARFKYPHGITTDGNNLYVADTYNNTIRKIVIATGEVTTLAGSAGSLSGFADGTGAAARFNYPQGITTDGINLYVADTGNSTIRKVVIATGEVTTFAGSAGSAARFNYPQGITTDGINLYVADTGNNTIRGIVIATGEVTTLAGSGLAGSTDGTGSAAKFKNPSGITTDGTNLYVADTNNNTIRKVVIATGDVTTLAGSGLEGSADGTGSAAKFKNPSGITIDGTNLYVADTNNNTIRKIVIATGEVTTLAGSAGSSGSADGTGAAATFNNPGGVTTDGISLYVTDSNNELIRKIH